ncbi:universal stress protein [Xanthocytophaga agilis]|uniref:Universal stress protein n=1 Tax=Xanthocytophaga agilis TaxID=3048010 RepID=A0AAE3R9K1_9BACT|nr:universal stress protein [Xanthocytophaga agilis]MDJ1506426.1 universal stress protein [Xanthocytophaga agilis]
MKTFIVCTDYSESAQQATRYAAALAAASGVSTLVLYHAFVMPVPVSEVPIDIPTEEQLIEESLDHLKQIAQDIKQDYSFTIEYFTSAVPVWEAVPLLIRKFHADLIIIGLKPVSELDRLVFGSTAARLIQHTTLPVLAVPENVSFTPLDQIVLAYEDQQTVSTHKLELLQKLAAVFHSHVEIVHIDKPEEVLTNAAHTSRTKKVPRLEEVLQGISHEYAFVEEETPLSGIKQSIKEYHPNLLVMMPHHRSIWEMILHRSTTRRMVFRTPVPLLILPSDK